MTHKTLLTHGGILVAVGGALLLVALHTDLAVVQTLDLRNTLFSRAFLIGGVVVAIHQVH